MADTSTLAAQPEPRKSQRATASAADVMLTPAEKRAARAELRRNRAKAFLLVAPLLVFLGFAFIAPIATMLFRSVHSPSVATLIPQTLASLEAWSGQGLPDDRTQTDFALELRALFLDRRAGRLGEEINRSLPGSSSIIQRSARALGGMEEQAVAEAGPALLAQQHAAWTQPEIWRTLQRAGEVYTDRFFLTALDLERNPEGRIQARESARIYIDLYARTLRMALTITVLTILLGYPLAFYLAHQRASRANLLIIFVLLPFWTSLLVRTTAWIALLQTNGVVNSSLMAIGIISEPLTLLYTEFATVLA
ncbi:MAG: ABC transporter permease, partial [Roseinatronobacter sp.]|nr:ABC transporter permease [Roseinatronobacter sp.]